MLSNVWLHMRMEVGLHFYFHFSVSWSVIRPIGAFKTLCSNIHNLTWSQVLNLSCIRRLRKWLLEICALLLHFNDICIVRSIHLTIATHNSCFRRHLELASNLSVHRRVKLCNLTHTNAVRLDLGWLRLLIKLLNRIVWRMKTICEETVHCLHSVSIQLRERQIGDDLRLVVSQVQAATICNVLCYWKRVLNGRLADHLVRPSVETAILGGELISWKSTLIFAFVS